MNKWLHRLASLKLTVVLLVAILVALTTGTLVEARHGSEAAARAVYDAPWFLLLLAAFAVNLLFSIVERWPPDRNRIGFLVTHSAMLLILGGAWVSYEFKVEGQLALWEGESSNAFVERSADGAQRLLPFSVRLDSFEIDTYPGTHRPAMFRSRVTLTDPAAGAPFPAVIQMNRELAYRGFKLFQSSYQMGPGGREMSVLAVSHDPGQGVVFLGYGLLMVGMVTVLGTRIAQRRARARRASGAKPARWLPRAALSAVLPLTLGISLAAASSSAALPPLPDPATVDALRALPVQKDGRMMPFDTVAREAVFEVTGAKHGTGDIDPVAMALGWCFDPSAWAGEPVVAIGSGELAAAAGLPRGTRYASFRTLVGSPEVRRLMSRARSEAQAERPISPLERAAQKLEERLLWMQQLLTREVLTVIPSASDIDAPWSVPSGVSSAAELVAFMKDQRAHAPAGYPAEAVMQREVLYNRVQPSRLAWWILVPATLLALTAWLRPRRALDVLAVAGLVAGFAVMTWGIATRWQIAGHIPASNMYESLLFLGWGVGLFALVAAVVLRNRLIILDAAAMSALAMVLVDRLPIDPFLHPMPPVLAGTPWLAIHVPIIMVSYSVLALAVLVAHLEIGLEIFAPARRQAAERMNDLLYWYLHVGSILLIAGILTGSIWAASSWGRYWGWDPKEVWSLIAFLAYMAILHGRFDRLIGPFGVAAASIVAFWAILMTYLGVNFVLTTGLHSYGFGGGAVVRWMLLVAAAEVAFLGAGFLAHRRNLGAGSAPPRLAGA